MNDIKRSVNADREHDRANEDRERSARIDQRNSGPDEDLDKDEKGESSEENETTTKEQGGTGIPGFGV